MKKVLFLSLLLFIYKSNLFSQSNSNEEKTSLYKYALEMFNDSKYDLAIDYCSNIINKYGGDAETYKLRARAYRSNGDYETAVKDYSTAISIFLQQNGRRDPSLSFDKGMVLMCQKKFDQALTEFNDARRIFRLTGLENFIYLEEIGRASHYKDDNKYAIETLKTAIQLGSTSAYIDLLSSLFHNNDFPELKTYSNLLLNATPPHFMTDSMFYYYISALNDIAVYSISENTLNMINRSLKNYKTSNNSCYQGFYNDILFARAFTNSFLGNELAAYNDYRFIYKNNSWNSSAKNKINELKIKLGIDITPPDIVLRNPITDPDNRAKIKASKKKTTIYGQVTDTSGIELITVNSNDRLLPPITSTEVDGLFGINIELNPGLNKIVISAIDKNENSSAKTFYIDFEERIQTASRSIEDTLFVDDIPEINTSVNYFAVLIAEKDYEDDGFKDLMSPIDDAIEIKDILINQYAFNEENVKLLANASRQSIIDTLSKMCKLMNESDNLLIFYAGHGAEKRINNEITGGYIIPSDAKKGNRGTYISNDDLVGPVSDTKARHVLFIVDACFAGLMRSTTMDDAPQGVKILYNNKSRRILTSGNREEVPDQGQFIVNVKNFLRSPGGKFIPASELYNYITNNNHSNNTPIYERIQNTGDAMVGQFIFVKR